MRLSVLNVIGRTSPSSCSLVPEGLTPGPARRGWFKPSRWSFLGGYLLRAVRRDEQVGGGIRVAQRRAGQDAAEPDAVVVAEARNTSLQLFDEARVTIERSDQHAVPVPVSEVGQCLDQEILPLVRTEDSDADQVAADGPAGGSDPIDARPGDVHPAGRDRVPGQDLPAGPFTGNDHAGGS